MVALLNVRRKAHIENEEGANPSVDTVKRLIEYFEISFEEHLHDIPSSVLVELTVCD